MPRRLYAKALRKVSILFIEASNDRTCMVRNGRAKPFSSLQDNQNIDRLKVSEFDSFYSTCVHVRKYMALII